MRYVLSIILILAIVVSISSCLPFFNREDTTQLAKDEFSQYFNGKDEVALIHYGYYFYFESHCLKIRDLEYYDGEPALVIYDGLIYYLSKNYPNDCVNFYSCDFYGNNIQKIYSHSIEDGKVLTNAHGIDDTFFIKYAYNDLRYIDQYSVHDGMYSNIEYGEECNLWDYAKQPQGKYSVEVNSPEKVSDEYHGEFVITDLESGIERRIDDEYLKTTPYFESMKKFNYAPRRCDISKGRILLTYWIGAGDGWNYSHLVFEYDFESDNFEYKLLAFTNDSITIEIIYTGK